MDVSLFIKEKTAFAVKDLYGIEVASSSIAVEHPKNSDFGDYSTNVAFMISKQVKQSPVEIARNVSSRLMTIIQSLSTEDFGLNFFEKIDFVEPGFINFALSENFLTLQCINEDFSKYKLDPDNTTSLIRGKKVLFEYTDPNPFKVFHIGHLLPNVVGESLSRIYQFLGADVVRANYQGDVGLHVAKAVWGAIKKLEDENKSFSDIESLTISEKIKFLSECYVLGDKFYTDEKATAEQEEMKEINIWCYMAAQDLWKGKKVDYTKYLPEKPKFSLEQIKEIYIKGREWSLQDFETIYERLGTKFDAYYFESLVGEMGLDIVNDGKNKGIFVENEGATIFKGEDFGLHTRVFINSIGLPTYEAKELGLAFKKYEDHKYDMSFIITANEIDAYFKVLIKAIEQLDPEIAKKTTHLSHGLLKFKEGKMSSRKGNVITGVQLLDEVKEEVENMTDLPEISDKVAVAAVKYMILKYSLGKDIIYDKEQILAITGNTGPYLQYAFARTQSVLQKGTELGYLQKPELISEIKLKTQEKDVLRHISKFFDIVLQSQIQNAPNLICEYLFELSQKYNTFYNDLPILNAELEEEKTLRLMISQKVGEVLKNGLWLLGIEAPERV